MKAAIAAEWEREVGEFRRQREAEEARRLEEERLAEARRLEEERLAEARRLEEERLAQAVAGRPSGLLRRQLQRLRLSGLLWRRRQWLTPSGLLLGHGRCRLRHNAQLPTGMRGHSWRCSKRALTALGSLWQVASPFSPTRPQIN